MPNFHIRPFSPNDIPQIRALQLAYQHVYPHAVVIPGEVYLSPGFEAGANIFCAFDEQACLQGYAPVLPSLTSEPQLPNVVWAEVKAGPTNPAAREVKDLLFEQVEARTREILRVAPAKSAQLMFQYHPSETASIEYVLSKSGSYTATVFRMMFDLSHKIPEAGCPEGIEVRYWRMDTEDEQWAYVHARNEAFPESPVAVADWQAFLRSPLWQQGCAVTAFDGPEVVGSVAAYCDDALSEYTGNQAGLTEHIFVRSRWRGRGIAAHLISQSLRFLKEGGRDAAYLEVKDTNEDALGLYKRLGYEVIDETRLYSLQF